MISRIEDVGVVRDAKAVQSVEYASNVDVHIEGNGGGSDETLVAAADAFTHRLHALRFGVERAPSAILGNLKEERLAGLGLPCHEVNALVCRSIGLFGIGILHTFRAGVAICAIIFVKTMLPRVGASDVPLAEMRSSIAKRFQVFGNRNLG